MYTIIGDGSGLHTTGRCSDPTPLWLIGSEHLLVVSNSDPNPDNGVKYNELFRTCYSQTLSKDIVTVDIDLYRSRICQHY